MIRKVKVVFCSLLFVVCVACEHVGEVWGVDGVICVDGRVQTCTYHVEHMEVREKLAACFLPL